MRGVALDWKALSRSLSNLSWLLEMWGKNGGNVGKR